MFKTVCAFFSCVAEGYTLLVLLKDIRVSVNLCFPTGMCIYWGRRAGNK